MHSRWTLQHGCHIPYTGCMIPAAELFAGTGTCLIVIERDSGVVLEHHGYFPSSPPEGLEGRDWRDALGVPPDSTAVIAQAINAGVSAALPPTAVAAGADGDTVMGGMVVPEYYREREVVLLFLRRLATDTELLADGGVEPLDIVAVLGVDRLEFSPTWGAVETDRLMMDLRNGLQQIVRDGDRVGLPAGATITVTLRGLEPEAALDISRALLSHLHQRLAQQDGGAQFARACIGLSQRLEGQDPLTAVLAANGALLQAQSGGEERIRFSSPWDPLGLAARAINATGAFRDARGDIASRNYLEELARIPLGQLPSQACLEQLLSVTLQQSGLEAAAILRRDYSGVLSSLSAAQGAGDSFRVLATGKLPRSVASAVRKFPTDPAEVKDGVEIPQGGCMLPLAPGGKLWGYLALVDADANEHGFRPGVAAVQYLANVLGESRFAGATPVDSGVSAAPLAREMEKGIEGYVLDNMEGAIDQAVFLSGVEIPVAVVGPRGTGKMYVAQVIHAEAGGEPGGIARIDCRSFRNRNEAQTRIARELAQGENRTVVFKSPHLLHSETQAKLARQLATRTQTDSHGTRYLPPARYVALFPDSLDTLIRKGELDERLASVFAGYPIQVPPLRDRGRAALRWAHKILEQESARVDRRVLGFTPDAEQAMLRHEWPGNISEMRDVICAALDRTDKEWITPVDLGIFMGITADGLASNPPEKPFLELMQDDLPVEPQYSPSTLEELRMALGQALSASLETGAYRPLGAWLDDELILAASERYANDGRGVAEFLHTRARNVSRWMPRLEERSQERNASLLWQESQKLIRQWVLEAAPMETPPQQVAQDILMSLVLQQCADLSVADRARIMGVSTPTYQKRLKQLLQEV